MVIFHSYVSLAEGTIEVSLGTNPLTSDFIEFEPTHRFSHDLLGV